MGGGRNVFDPKSARRCSHRDLYARPSPILNSRARNWSPRVVFEVQCGRRVLMQGFGMWWRAASIRFWDCRFGFGRNACCLCRRDRVPVIGFGRELLRRGLRSRRVWRIEGHFWFRLLNLRCWRCQGISLQLYNCGYRFRIINRGTCGDGGGWELKISRRRILRQVLDLQFSSQNISRVTLKSSLPTQKAW